MNGKKLEAFSLSGIMAQAGAVDPKLARPTSVECYCSSAGAAGTSSPAVIRM